MLQILLSISTATHSQKPFDILFISIYPTLPSYFCVSPKQQRKVKARSLFCFWAVTELGMSLRELARRLEMSSPGVGFSVERGETIARKNGLQLIE